MIDIYNINVHFRQSVNTLQCAHAEKICVVADLLCVKRRWDFFHFRLLVEVILRFCDLLGQNTFIYCSWSTVVFVHVYTFI